MIREHTIALKLGLKGNPEDKKSCVNPATSPDVASAGIRHSNLNVTPAGVKVQGRNQ